MAKPEDGSAWNPLTQAMSATGLTFAAINLIYFPLLAILAPPYFPRLAFAYRLIFNLPVAVILLLASWVAAKTRSWLVPAFVGFVLVALASPPFVWSGPGDQGQIAVHVWIYRSNLLLVAVPINMAIIYLLAIRRRKTASS